MRRIVGGWLTSIGIVTGLGVVASQVGGSPNGAGPATATGYLLIHNAGQSNGFGHSPAVTETQEYESVLLRSGTMTFQTAVGTGREAPMYGAMGLAKHLLTKEDGQRFTEANFPLVATDTTVSAKSIDELAKGGSAGAYENGLSSLVKARAAAKSLGKSLESGAILWTQGEADAGTPMAAYKSKLIAYVERWNADAKAITGQTRDIPLITWQVGSNYRKDVALAQWRAGVGHPLVFLASPSYQFDYEDFQHLTSDSIKWLGGYYGLVFKRVVVDRSRWEPLQPVEIEVSGNNIDITFNKTGLIFDTTLMPRQADYGFSVINERDGQREIRGAFILAGNRVRLTMVDSPSTGWRVRYGHNLVTGKLPYRGGGGNLRDTQQLTYAGHPMHNWCVIFDWKI